MSVSQHQSLLDAIADTFGALATRLEHVIELLKSDDSGTVEIGPLHFARDAARRGASLTRDATSDVRRAFE